MINSWKQSVLVAVVVVAAMVVGAELQRWSLAHAPAVAEIGSSVASMPCPVAQDICDTAASDQTPPVIQNVEDAARPHPHNRFISMDGTFFVLPWDDREISDEQKKADPIYNPAWVPFARCMEAHGVAVRSGPGAKFTQGDLDALVSRLNRENPDRAANLALPFKSNGTVGGTVGAFLDCGEQWLTKTPQEIQTLTGVVEPTLPPSTPLPVRTAVPSGR